MPGISGRRRAAGGHAGESAHPQDHSKPRKTHEGHPWRQEKIILAEKLDNYVMEELHLCIENIRIISKYPLHTLIDATVSDKDNVNFRNMHIVYNSIDRVFTFLALYFSVKDLIGDEEMSTVKFGIKIQQLSRFMDYIGAKLNSKIEREENERPNS